MPNSTNKLLPSLAFVSCLVDSSQSIYDVLCSLSKYALWKTQSLVFTREQARQRVNDFYGFELPQALITRVLKILVTRSLCTRSSQKYALSANDNGLYEQMDSDFDTTTSTHNELIISIQAFIKKNNGVALAPQGKTIALQKQHSKQTLIKCNLGNAQLFRLARHEVFLKQEWTLPSSTVSKKAK